MSTSDLTCIFQGLKGPSWPWSYGSLIYTYLCNQCLSPLMLWIQISIRVRCITLCGKVCQWFATGRWFSLGPPVSSTNKTDRHDITVILLKVALNTIKPNHLGKTRIPIYRIMSVRMTHHYILSVITFITLMF